MKFRDREHFEEELAKSITEPELKKTAKEVLIESVENLVKAFQDTKEPLKKNNGFENPKRKPRFQHGSTVEIAKAVKGHGYHVTEHPKDGSDSILHKDIPMGELSAMTRGKTVKFGARPGKNRTNTAKVINQNRIGDTASHSSLMTFPKKEEKVELKKGINPVTFNPLKNRGSKGKDKTMDELISEGKIKDKSPEPKDKVTISKHGDYVVKSRDTGEPDHDAEEPDRWSVHHHDISYKGKHVGTAQTRVEGGHHQSIGSDLSDEHDLHFDHHIVGRL